MGERIRGVHVDPTRDWPSSPREAPLQGAGEQKPSSSWVPLALAVVAGGVTIAVALVLIRRL